MRGTMSQSSVSDLDTTVLSARVTKSRSMFADILRIYVKAGSVIVDLNYGKGCFWSYTDTSQYNLIRVDLDRERLRGADCSVCCDHSVSSFRDNSIDVVVIDPPYGCLSTTPRTDRVGNWYNLAPTTLNGIPTYHNVMIEADRILKKNGVVIIKCQDAVNSSKQHFTHISIYTHAMVLGWRGEDLFVMVQSNRPRMRHNYQVHSRKSLSCFWVFKKMKILKTR